MLLAYVLFLLKIGYNLAIPVLLLRSSSGKDGTSSLMPIEAVIWGVATVGALSGYETHGLSTFQIIWIGLLSIVISNAFMISMCWLLFRDTS